MRITRQIQEITGAPCQSAKTSFNIGASSIAREKESDPVGMDARLRSIPSFADLHENLATAGQPSKEQLEAVAASGFRVVVNLGLDDPAYALPDERAFVTSLGMRYVHIPVQFSSPQMDELERFMAAMAEAAGQKVFVHCRHNKRVPVFIALDRIVRQGWKRAEALAEMERIWKPDADWRQFIDTCLAGQLCVKQRRKEQLMSTPNGVNENIQAHYNRSDLANTILGALERAGKDLDNLTPEDLAPIDEFHIRGRAATLELARAAGLDSSKRVLDVGSGIGGTSRCLAREYGCRIIGIDLTEEYCRAAEALTERIGLADLAEYRQGDATNLPFPDAAFDVVWTEHVAMNIPDKARLYSEMHRVLKPGGVLAIYDILAGPSGPVLFPVPWARTPETSFLVTPGEMRNLLEEAGFTVTNWSDTTDVARAWFVALAERIRKDGLPPLGFHLLMGSDFQAMAQNQRRNLEEGRIALAQVVATK